MQITTTTNQLDNLKTECLVLGINAKLQPNLTQSSTKITQLVKKLNKLGDFAGQVGESLLIIEPEGLACKRLLLIGTGEDKNRNVYQFRKILDTTFSNLLKTKATDIVTTLNLATVTDHDDEWTSSELLIKLHDALYQFEDFKSEKQKSVNFKKFCLAVADSKAANKTKKIIKQTTHLASGIKLTKDLGNTPPNICNPSYLANQAKALSRKYSSLSVEVIDQKQAEKLGMGAFIAVAKGSDSPGKIVIIKHKAKTSTNKPVVLVGKGITFDTGGYCLKQPIPMTDMKYDMCGAATVLGVLKTCAEMQLNKNVIGIIACAENMINGNATRVSDIVKSFSGKTIEITNTDAEGRLVLCDALAYAKKFKPSKVISVATLTGAAIISLGFENTALMSNNQTLADHLLDAGIKAEDRAWQLPLHEEYHEYLKSDYADLINASLNRVAGSITAACFLANFTKEFDWAHLDIAGTSIISGRQAKASGRPVPLLINYLLNH